MGETALCATCGTSPEIVHTQQLLQDKFWYQCPRCGDHAEPVVVGLIEGITLVDEDATMRAARAAWNNRQRTRQGAAGAS